MIISWAERQVIECAGISAEDASPKVVLLAREALSECYYIQRAAEWLCNELYAPHDRALGA